MDNPISKPCASKSSLLPCRMRVRVNLSTLPKLNWWTSNICSPEAGDDAEIDATDAINMGELNGFSNDDTGTRLLLMRASSTRPERKGFWWFSLLRLWLTAISPRVGIDFVSSCFRAVLLPVLKFKLYSSGEPVAFDWPSTSESLTEPSFLLVF